MPMTSEELIERVRDNPAIWLSSHPYHMNRAVLRRFWSGLASEAGDSENRLRKRWKHYKDQFRKEYKRAQEKSLPIDVISWPYFKALSFLEEDILQKEQDILLKRSEQIKREEDELPLSDSKHKPKILKLRVVKKMPSNIKLDLILKGVKETKDLVHRKLTDMQMANTNDPDVLFLMSLIPSIKQLTEIQKLQFKGKINDWLLQEITLNNYDNSADTFDIALVKTEKEDDSKEMIFGE